MTAEAALVALILVSAVLGFLAWLDHEGKSWVRAANQREAMFQDMQRRNSEKCEICSGKAVYLCPTCMEPIESHSHENDFICKTHSFVTPIRQHDGARICGDGSPGPLRVVSE